MSSPGLLTKASRLSIGDPLSGHVGTMTVAIALEGEVCREEFSDTVQCGRVAA